MMTISRLVSYLFIALILAPLSAEEPAVPQPETIPHPADAQEQHSGLWVVLGVNGPDLLLELAEKTAGKVLIQGLSTDPAMVATVRQSLAEQGLIPLVDVKQVASYEHLPYADELISALIINEPGLAGAVVPETEITRTVFFERPVIRGESGSWSMIKTTMPDDVDEWTHMFHGPNNIPYSKDHRVGPWVNGLRFTIGDSVAGGKQNSLVSRATRLAGGRMFILGTKRGAGRTSKVMFRARDAASGLPLWEREVIELKSNRTRRVPSAEDVVGWFNPEGPMLRLDAATGEELMSYDQGISLKIGKHLMPAKGEKAKRAMGTGTMHENTIQVMVQGDQVVQVAVNEIASLDRVTGAKHWHYEAGDVLVLQATMDKEGHVYAVLVDDLDMEYQKKFIQFPGQKVVSLDAESGSVRWEIDLENHDYSGRSGRYFPRVMTGPADGMIWLAGYYQLNDDKIHRVGNNTSMIINAETGAVLRDKPGGGVRNHSFIIDGELYNGGAYSGMGFVDPVTGNPIRTARTYAQPGGCGIHTLTPKYVMRGQMLHLREKPEEAFASAGFRPHCEAPMMPAYGAVYSGQSGICGCAWWLPTAYLKSGAYHPQPDVAKRTTNPDSLTGTQFPKPQGLLVDEWKITKSTLPSAKSERSSKMPPSAQKTAGQHLGSLKKSMLGQWYGQGPTPANTVDGVTYWADVHNHRIVATQGTAPKVKQKKGVFEQVEVGAGQPVLWTSILDARISTAPILVDGVLIAATHAGAVYGLDPATGETKWRTLVAPNDQQMVAFGQMESLWPCFGVVEHEGIVATTAGRVSTLDSGFYSAGIKPADGSIIWRVNQVAESVHFTDIAKQIPKARGWGTHRSSHPGQPFSRAFMSLNTPPMITRGHLHGGGMLMVDLSNPQDFAFTFSNDLVQQLPELPEK